MNLLSLKFWFAISPIPLRPSSFTVLLIVFAFFVTAGILAKVIANAKRSDFVLSRAARRAGRPLIPIGIVGLILLFFEYERAAFLSSRFWYLLLLAWFGYSIWRFAQYLTKHLPVEKKAMENRIRLEKYLPKHNE